MKGLTNRLKTLTNLLKNPGFDEGVAGWHTVPDASIDVSNQVLTFAASMGQESYAEQRVSLRGPGAYLFAFTCRVRQGGHSNVTVVLSVANSEVGRLAMGVIHDPEPVVYLGILEFPSFPVMEQVLRIRVLPTSNPTYWWMDELVLAKLENTPPAPGEELIRDGNFSEAGHPDWVLENAEIYDTDPPLSAHAVLGFGDAHIAQKIRPQKEGTYLLRFDLMSPEDWPERPGRVIISVGGHAREDRQEFGSDGTGEYVGMIFLLEFTKEEIGRDDVEVRIAKIVQPGLRVIWHIDNVSLKRITPPT